MLSWISIPIPDPAAASWGADMNNREFLFWLQGYFELDAGATRLFTSEQLRLIRNHLNLVRQVDGHLEPFAQKLEEMLDTLERGGPLAQNLMAVLGRELDSQFTHAAGGPPSAPDPLRQTMC